MRFLAMLTVVVLCFSCATTKTDKPAAKCADCKPSATACCKFLREAEPSPGENRANVPIVVRDNTWYLQVPPNHEGPVVIRYVAQPVSVVNVCTGEPLKCSYAEETATIADLPPRETPTVIAVQWYVAPWLKEFKAFDEQDRLQRPAEGGTLFVGSSTIVGWKLDEYFPGLNATNRGFGGSQFVDAIHYAERVVVQYKPRTIVVYDGDNDMAEGQSPERVLANVEALIRRIQFHLPEARIIILSIKPSFSRWNVWDKMKQANALIETCVKSHSNVVYVDIASALLGANGRPRPECYGPDGLHLSPEGYEACSALLRPLLIVEAPPARG